MDKSNAVHALLFGHSTDITLDERTRVLAELQKIGSLTFNVTINDDGWMAQCKEVSGIIAGGTNPHPTNSEIEIQIRDAIFAAFDVKTQTEEAGTDFRASPYFTYNDFTADRPSHTVAQEL